MKSSGSSHDYLMDKLYSHLKEIATLYVNLAYTYMMSDINNPDAQMHMKHEENFVVEKWHWDIFLSNTNSVLLCQYDFTNFAYTFSHL